MTSIPGEKQAWLFKDTNFGETNYKYLLKAPTRYSNQAGELRSLRVGSDCKVNIWTDSGNLVTLKTGEYPDLFNNSVPNIKIIQPLEDRFKFSIDIKFNHTIQGKPADNYDLTIKPLQFENTVIKSGSPDYMGVQIPELTPPDSLIVSQVSVREAPWPHQIVANGSIYFKYNPSNNTITYEKTEGWPINMDIVQNDTTGFTITLKGV
ncbi:hypothetical protein RB653_008174 [Dictyostelium firmibasis]|uniref:Calcium-dependent cell adhesion molecule 1 membrane-binding domain-containing protein n=1 Tax=Dictyostelium firmibasis TaxID=79012 RepID=A0AAN7TYG5_9MYCE